MGNHIKTWQRIVQQHHEQTIHAQNATLFSEPKDFWKPFTRFFTQDPTRTSDPEINALLKYIQPDDTILDVGGGAGRLALPIALNSKHVEIVDPSAGMLDSLTETAQKFNIQNVHTTHGEWLEVNAQNATIVICAHVVYGIYEIAEFIDKLSLYADREVILLSFDAPPISWLSPFWEFVYQEKRIAVPALKELVNVLWEKDIFPNIEMIEPSEGKRRKRGYEDIEVAIENIAPRIFISKGSKQEEKLREAIKILMIDNGDGLHMIDQGPERHLAIVRWHT